MQRRAANTGAGPDALSDGRLPVRGRPLVPQVYALLRRAIVRGELAPGDPIDERRVAARLGVSRTPVREAVRRLVDERLVVVVAQSSTRTAPLDRALIEESRLIRRALEMESAAQAAPRMNAKHAARLRAAIAEQRACIREGRYGDAIDADDRFHHAIAAVSGLERLWRTIEIEKAHVDRCRHRMVPLPGEAQATLVQHRRILEVLRGGDPVRAREAMRAHLDAAWRSARRMLDLEGGEPPSDTTPDPNEETPE